MLRNLWCVTMDCFMKIANRLSHVTQCMTILCNVSRTWLAHTYPYTCKSTIGMHTQWTQMSIAVVWCSLGVWPGCPMRHNIWPYRVMCHACDWHRHTPAHAGDVTRDRLSHVSQYMAISFDVSRVTGTGQYMPILCDVSRVTCVTRDWDRRTDWRLLFR